jgi:hypothetical protein
MNPHDLPVPVPDPALVRFVTAGLLATVESYLDGTLPLPRLARELAARTDALTELAPPARTLTRLRWLHRDVARLDAALRDAGRTEPDPHERARLAATLGALRDTLATLLSPGPLDPAGAGRPAAGPAAVGIATARCAIEPTVREWPPTAAVDRVAVAT